MSLKIEVFVPEAIVAEKRAADYLADAMAAICFTRNVTLALPEQASAAGSGVGSVPAEVNASKETEGSAPAAPETMADAAPKRERGKPAPGKARRTKAEIEEDEAADAADAAAASNNAPAETEAEPTEQEKADEAQDAEDEAADPGNAPSESATRDDVRAAMMAYGEKMGMPALTADMTAILADKFPDGSVKKLSEIPEDAAAFQSVIDALRAKMGG